MNFDELSPPICTAQFLEHPHSPCLFPLSPPFWDFQGMFNDWVMGVLVGSVRLISQLMCVPSQSKLLCMCVCRVLRPHPRKKKMLCTAKLQELL